MLTTIYDFIVGIDLLEWLKIDDPVGCIPVHGITGIWGLLAVGLFAEKVPHGDSTISPGLFKGGDASFLGVQALACVCIISWASLTTIIEVSEFFVYHLLAYANRGS